MFDKTELTTDLLERHDCFYELEGADAESMVNTFITAEISNKTLHLSSTSPTPAESYCLVTIFLASSNLLSKKRSMASCPSNSPSSRGISLIGPSPAVSASSSASSKTYEEEWCCSSIVKHECYQKPSILTWIVQKTFGQTNPITLMPTMPL